jgi:hypothetical protein
MRHRSRTNELLALYSAFALLACDAPPDPDSTAESNRGGAAERSAQNHAGAGAVPALTDEELDHLLDALEEELAKPRR